MLVINGVELVSLDQGQKVREFHRDHAVLFEEHLHGRYEVVDVRNVRQYVISNQEVGAAILFDKGKHRTIAKKLDFSTDTFLHGQFRGLSRRLDSQYWYALLNK